jgi:alpha/beta superfamily hydrolase
MRLGVSQQLAHALAAVGVATLRFDKRGVGQSPGDWRAAGLFDNVDDAEAALAWLTRQPDVEGERVFLIGHSEGAVVATALAARQDR